MSHDRSRLPAHLPTAARSRPTITCAAVVGLLLLGAAPARSQQVADTAYTPPIGEPDYPAGEGPVVLVDAAHHNFHTADERYLPFARLLRRAGYQVLSNLAALSDSVLAGADVLVIANALAEENVGEWYLPTPSAFTEEEIAAVERWVSKGGGLCLIADHMPFPGAAGDLAAAFGIRFQNGFAVNPESGGGTLTFRKSDTSLRSHPVTDGRIPGERVDSVTAFTGQGFRLDRGADAARLMVLPEPWILLLPEIAWQFSTRTPRIPAVGLLQGALVDHGEGRVAAFGEAAMFTAQLSGSNRVPMGMNVPEGGQNHRLVLNVLLWLTGRLE